MDRRSFITGAVAGASATGVLGSAAWYAGVMQPPDSGLPGPRGPNSPYRGRLSFSQQGEDIVLYHVLHDLMKVAAPTYVDIGAADPIQDNNTYLLYCTGGSGVVVEPNPSYAEKLRRYRPKDTVVNAGIGVSDASEADYYIVRGRPTLNTFSPDQIAMLRRGSKDDIVEKVVKMPLISVNRLIAQCLGKAPDLLAIDVEGLDLAILRTLDFATYRPAVIIAETIRMGAADENTDIAVFLASKGYVVRGGSLINTVFADPGRYA